MIAPTDNKCIDIINMKMNTITWYKGGERCNINSGAPNP